MVGAMVKDKDGGGGHLSSGPSTASSPTATSTAAFTACARTQAFHWAGSLPMETLLSRVGLHQHVAEKHDSEGEEEGSDLSPSQASEDQSHPEEGLGSAEGDQWLPSCGSWATPMVSSGGREEQEGD